MVEYRLLQPRHALIARECGIDVAQPALTSCVARVRLARSIAVATTTSTEAGLRLVLVLVLVPVATAFHVQAAPFAAIAPSSRHQKPGPT